MQTFIWQWGNFYIFIEAAAVWPFDTRARINRLVNSILIQAVLKQRDLPEAVIVAKRVACRPVNTGFDTRRPPSKTAKGWGVLNPHSTRTSLEGRQIKGGGRRLAALVRHASNQRISFGDVQSIDESGCPGLMLASKSVRSKSSRVSSTANPIRIRFPSSSKA
jgi:hypothetical protein